VRLANHRLLDALCGEYLLGTLRGAARRRFEVCLRAEPLVAQRLRHWEATIMPRYSERIEEPAPRHVWRRLERDLELSKFRLAWHQRVGTWKALAAIASAALIVVVLVAVESRPGSAPSLVEIAQLSDKEGGTHVSAQLSRDGRILALKANRPVLAGPNQSYELWLIPSAGAAPVSVAVLGSLDASLPLTPERFAQLRPGVTLAISTEPAGGSPTGQPTGAVILVGRVGT